MAPPDRSRRRRHGKSPRNKRFGSGKSTPSSPAGTPTRLPHTHRVSDLAGGTSRDSVLSTPVEDISNENLAAVAEQLAPLESSSATCSSEAAKSEYEPLKDINEETSTLKGDLEDNHTMSGGSAKLDRLCGLLDNIVIEHKDSVTKSNTSATSTPVKAQKVKKDEGPPAVQSSNEVKPKEEKTREDIELERKARKEAKKAKKKGSNKENEKDAGDAVDSSKGESSKKSLQVTPKAQNKVEEAPKKAVSEVGAGFESEPAGKSKADMKRERREKQEAQRKAKAEAKAQQEKEKKQKQQSAQQGSKKAESQQQSKKKAETEGKRGRDKKSVEKDRSERRIPLLGHLTPHSSQPPPYPVNCESIHPAIRTLGIKMKDRVIDSSTARVISMLAAFKRVIGDYQTPESCDLHRDLAEKLVSNMAYLRACRPQNIAMDNAIRFLKHEVNSVGPSLPEAQAKDDLRSSIDEYIRENIVLASSTIASHAAQVIKDGDVILTYGYSALVSDVIEAAKNRGEEVSVVVADTPHPPSGAAMAKRLADLGITTYYRLITEVSHIMNKVTKVIVEADSVMMNGAVQGLCGTAGLALAAATHDTPFIVLCHTYKFCNNDLTDSLVLNELGDADSVVCCPGEYCNLLSDWREMPNLNVVNLVYDITPANLVTALITEQNVLPTSAVPVIIRRNYADILGQD